MLQPLHLHSSREGLFGKGVPHCTVHSNSQSLTALVDCVGRLSMPGRPQATPRNLHQVALPIHHAPCDTSLRTKAACCGHFNVMILCVMILNSFSYGFGTVQDRIITLEFLTVNDSTILIKKIQRYDPVLNCAKTIGKTV